MLISRRIQSATTVSQNSVRNFIKEIPFLLLEDFKPEAVVRLIRYYVETVSPRE
jgi:hypothetical protein